MSLTFDLPASEIRRWRRYPRYKDSGVAWIGEIPEHWSVVPLKQLTALVSRGNSPEYVDESSIQVINQACIYWDGLRLENVKHQKESDISRWKGCLQRGDLLLNSTATGTLGRAAIFNHPGLFIADSHVTIIRVLHSYIDVRFVYYLIKSPAYQGYIYAALIAGSTNQIELSREGLRAMQVITPPFPEQRLIANFLDCETGMISTLIAKKERLVELLQEKRAALISHAVTKGLDASAPMKDSGVDWLGKIPAHWKMKRVRDIAESLQTGPFGSQLHSDDYSPGGIPVINPAHMKNGSIEPDWDCAVDKETWFRLSHHALHEGDIIFARRGEMGRCALVTEKESGWLCGTGSLRIRPKFDICNAAFLSRVLSTIGVRDWLLLESVGSTMENLNTQILSNIPLPFPDISEQVAIAAYLDRETASIDALIARIREGIEKLKEYSVALISAAVTGKIDIREEIRHGCLGEES